MATAQCPARARGTLSSRVSITIGSHAIESRLRQASVLVHFHSFSWVATFTSSITSGTHPPNTYILFPMVVAECRLRGSGATPLRLGLFHVRVSMSSVQRSPSRQPLMPP